MDHNYYEQYDDIRLEPMNKHTSELYRQLRNLDIIRKWFETTDIITEENQKNWFNSYLTKSNELMFSILDSSNRFVGGCSLYNIIYGEKCDFGRLIISPDCHGNKFGMKAVLASVEIAKKLRIYTIHLEVFENNIAAIRSYTSAGFEQCGERFVVRDMFMIPMEIKIW